MNAAQLREAREHFGLSTADLAALLRMRGAGADRTVRKWESGELPVPGYVSLIFDIMRRHRQVERYLIGLRPSPAQQPRR